MMAQEPLVDKMEVANQMAELEPFDDQENVLLGVDRDGGRVVGSPGKVSQARYRGHADACANAGYRLRSLRLAVKRERERER